jgi:hypothetical protein
MINPFSPRVTMKRMRPFFGKEKVTAGGETAGGVGADSIIGGSAEAGSSKVGAGETAATASVGKLGSVVAASGGAAATRGRGLVRCGLGA